MKKVEKFEHPSDIFLGGSLSWWLWKYIVCVLIEDFYDIQFSSVSIRLSFLSPRARWRRKSELCFWWKGGKSEWMEKWEMSLTFLRFRLTYKNLIFQHLPSYLGSSSEDVSQLSTFHYVRWITYFSGFSSTQFNDLISFSPRNFQQKKNSQWSLSEIIIKSRF